MPRPAPAWFSLRGLKTAYNDELARMDPSRVAFESQEETVGGTWRSLVAHLHGVQGVPSSNLGVPTNLSFRIPPAPKRESASFRLASRRAFIPSALGVSVTHNKVNANKCAATACLFAVGEMLLLLLFRRKSHVLDTDIWFALVY